MLIKMKYKKSSKKIKVEEIVNSITTYCDKIEQYLKGSIPLEQRIVYNVLGVQDMKENAEKCLNLRKNGKISEKECARKITSGSSNGGSQIGGFSNLYHKVSKPTLILTELEKCVDQAKDKLKVDNLNLDNMKKSPNKANLKGVLQELEQHCKIDSEKDINTILENPSQTLENVKNEIKNIESDPVMRILSNDLSYLQSGKQKTSDKQILEKITQTKKAVTEAVKSMESIIKFVNKHLLPEGKIKNIKSDKQYTNQIKTTSDHYINVLDMVKQKQEKIKKKIEEAIDKQIDNIHSQRIKSSNEYQKFIKNKENIESLYQGFKHT